MKKRASAYRILILGASGFVGNALYKELLPYFDVRGTYCQQAGLYAENKVFYKFNVEKDAISGILQDVKPDIIISSLRGNFEDQFRVHQALCDYVVQKPSLKLLFISTVNVFDGNEKYPSYEDDMPHAESAYGKSKLSIEKMLGQLPPDQYAILRLPLVLGVNAPRIHQLKQASKNKTTFEVYPNLIISTTTVDKIAQQIHYIINKNCFGIFHLASDDVIHHEDLFVEITQKLGLNFPIFKSVYNTNHDRYLALLARKNKLPEPYGIKVSDVIDACTLKEEIITLKDKK